MCFDLLLFELVTARLACSSQCTFAMLLSCLWTGHWTCGRNLASKMLLGGQHGQHWQRGHSPSSFKAANLTAWGMNWQALPWTKSWGSTFRTGGICMHLQPLWPLYDVYMFLQPAKNTIRKALRQRCLLSANLHMFQLHSSFISQQGTRSRLSCWIFPKKSPKGIKMIKSAGILDGLDGLDGTFGWVSCRRNVLQVARLSPRMWLKRPRRPTWHGLMSLPSQPRPWKKCPPKSWQKWVTHQFLGMIHVTCWISLDIFLLGCAPILFWTKANHSIELSRSQQLGRIFGGGNLPVGQTWFKWWQCHAAHAKILWLVQGLVNVPFWEYWTSPEKVAIIDHIPNGWVMWKMGTWLMTHVVKCWKFFAGQLYGAWQGCCEKFWWRSRSWTWRPGGEACRQDSGQGHGRRPRAWHMGHGTWAAWRPGRSGPCQEDSKGASMEDVDDDDDDALKAQRRVLEGPGGFRNSRRIAGCCWIFNSTGDSWDVADGTVFIPIIPQTVSTSQERLG